MARNEVRYSDDLAARIVEFHASGKLIAEICDMDGMPHRATISRWAQERPAFRQALDEARKLCADALAEQAIAIVDTEKDPARARVRADARRWQAAKMKPEAYGEKIDVNMTGTISVAAALAEARARRAGMVIDHEPAAEVPAPRKAIGRAHRPIDAADIFD